MAKSSLFAPKRDEKNLIQKIVDLNWMIVLVLCFVAAIGIAMLYSVAGGKFEPWASRQALRFVMLLGIMVAMALIGIRFWMWLSYPAYAVGLLMLIAVEFIGSTGMGGQRWLDLGLLKLQPSELMKVAVVMALARYFHAVNPQDMTKLGVLIVPVFLIAIPALLVVRQPDLGTAILIIFGGISMLFVSGARAWIFVTGAIASLAAIPVIWQFMHEYQKSRVLIFLNPESDPLGKGYQIMQSKIALGSGGVFGKGYLQGTQSHLNFLPEMKTDFIFTVLAEEFGLAGGVFLIALYVVLLSYGVIVSVTCRSLYGRMLSFGLTTTIFLYVFINIAMVMGLLPVVGVPLPLVSYGGSAMMTMMLAYGLILSVSLNRSVGISRKDPFG